VGGAFTIEDSLVKVNANPYVVLTARKMANMQVHRQASKLEPQLQLFTRMVIYSSWENLT